MTYDRCRMYVDRVMNGSYDVNRMVNTSYDVSVIMNALHDVNEMATASHDVSRMMNVSYDVNGMMNVPYADTTAAAKSTMSCKAWVYDVSQFQSTVITQVCA